MEVAAGDCFTHAANIIAAEYEFESERAAIA
jgi:hypothetical protein